VACHEAGHAIQHARHYAPLVLRNAFVPVASIGSQFSFILIIVGLGLGAAQGAGLGVMVAVAGIALFGAVVLFQLINLVPEFDASSRAKRVLIDSGMITREESAGVSRVLTAAALTYVAATLIALVQLLYWVMVIFGNRRN
jgi:Zn-dependent membrane protease YugP